MEILVMGGTRFFGRRLVELLLEDGHDITIATRGQTSDDFGEKVKRIKVDRTNQSSMMRAFENRYFDVVYDQICFNPREAKIAVETFSNRIKRYVFTSSMAVYGHKETEIVESDFIPEDYKVNLDADNYAYDEGKRQAEAYFFQHAEFPVVAVRVAMVVSGNDDFTGRFDFYVGHVANGKSIGVFEAEHPITYVTAWDIADFLRMMGVKSGYQGPINAGNSGYLSIQELSREIGKLLGVSPRFHVGQSSHNDEVLSPYAMFPNTWKLSNAKANSLGYEFLDIRKWIPLMVEQSARRLGINQ